MTTTFTKGLRSHFRDDDFATLPTAFYGGLFVFGLADYLFNSKENVHD
nr:MAG TPA: hypothetical protein [Caudoviricetes sp.]